MVDALVPLGAAYTDTYTDSYGAGAPLAAVAALPAPTIVLGAGGVVVSPAKISAIAFVPTPTTDATVSNLPMMPTLLVEMDLSDLISGAKLDDVPTATLDTATLGGPQLPTFPIDITSYVRAASVDRGASNELQRIEAGTASIDLSNRDGRFTPFLATSPYYPNILPMKRIRIRATWKGVTYPVFQGFVEEWPVEFPEDVDTVTRVHLVDGFKLLSLIRISMDFPQQQSGERVAAVLDAAGWLTGETDIDVGTVTVAAVILEDAAPLEHIQQIAYAEGGRFFISRDGKATFRDRSSEVNVDFSTRTWADNGAGMPYREVTLSFDDSNILNDVRLTSVGGTEQAVFDETSQARYGIRSRVESDIQLSSDSQTLSFADNLLTRYAEPRLRLTQLLDNGMKHQLWERVLGRELSDAVTVIETRTATSQVSLMEGIHHDIPSEEWNVTVAVSPTVIEIAGVLDDATFGLLDSTAILAR